MLNTEQINHNAASLALALADLSEVGRWRDHGDGVIGTDIGGYEYVVAIQDDGAVCVARYDGGGERIDETIDDVAYDVDAVRAAIASLL